MDYTFDLNYIFMGETSPLFLLEVAFRTAFIFLYTLINLRFVGHRGLGQLSFFEFAIIISLGSAVGDPMFYPDVPLAHGMVVITMIVILQRFLIGFTSTNYRLERLVEGWPERLVCDGLLDLDGMKDARVSKFEVFKELRQRQVENLGQVRRAYLETDGEVSVFYYTPEQIMPGLPVLLYADEFKVTIYDAHQNAPQTGYYACYQCGQVEHLMTDAPLPICPRCGKKRWVEACITGMAAQYHR